MEHLLIAPKAADLHEVRPAPATEELEFSQAILKADSILLHLLVGDPSKIRDVVRQHWVDPRLDSELKLVDHKQLAVTARQWARDGGLQWRTQIIVIVVAFYTRRLRHYHMLAVHCGNQQQRARKNIQMMVCLLVSQSTLVPNETCPASCRVRWVSGNTVDAEV